MQTQAPRVSVVIPAYNQSHFLEAAIQSVLGQTYRDYEIIVVDDGSTDDTAKVAAAYGSQINYVYQENRGLSGARNTGIRQAHGEFIALLDSDDQWLPTFLETMMSRAEANPQIDLFFSGAHYTDAEGQTLPQIVPVKVRTADDISTELQKANFIIPSTVVIRRSVAIQAGLFDETLRSLEDWDLWLRLIPDHQFMGLEECLVLYRLHGSSLSTDPSTMQQAARTVVNKHFGADDGQPEQWPPTKRRAYSGLYWYHAWTSVMRRNDWDSCANYLRQALHIDPTFLSEPDVFYELALGAQPPGYRGVSTKELRLRENGINVEKLVRRLFEAELPATLKARQKKIQSNACFAIGLLAYNVQKPDLARTYFWRAFLTEPGSNIKNWRLLTLLGKSLLKSSVKFGNVGVIVEVP